MHSNSTFLLKAFLFLNLFIIATTTFAQKHNYSFSVKNAVDKKALSNASIVLIRAKDSAIVAFGITDTAGKYNFTNIKVVDDCKFIFSYLGFVGQTMNINAANPKPKTQEIFLQPDTAMLNEVIVRSGSPIRMNKDTLEYNTDFFKTMPNAVLEELLKKLPGFDVQKDGSIKVNGRSVSKILVDGKEFFSSDPKIVLKNLPAELIAKVQVADDKKTIATELRNKMDIPQVINLKLKKDVKKGVIAKIFAGGGTKNRYESGGLVNTFRDTLQVSLIGTSNNLSNSGFSMEDMNNLGGLDRASNAGGSTGIDNSWNMGIPKNNLVGTNINYNFTKDLLVNFQYFYKKNSFHNKINQRAITSLGDTSLTSINDVEGTQSEGGHQLHGGVQWKLDSTGFLTGNVNYNNANTSEVYTMQSTTASTNIPLMSTQNTISNSKNRSQLLSGDISLQKTFIKPKIDININGNWGSGHNETDNYTNNISTLYSTGFIPDSIIQMNNARLPNRNRGVYLGINKTMDTVHVIGFNVQHGLVRTSSGNNIYRWNPITDQYEYRQGQSSLVNQGLKNLNINLFYRYQQPKIDLSVSVGGTLKYLYLTNTYSVDTTARLNRRYNILSPDISINYKSFRFSLSRDMETPSVSNMNPVVDSSSALSYSKGNPNLTPERYTKLLLAYNKYWYKSQINFYAGIDYAFSKGAITNKRNLIDGINYSEYLNYGNINRYNLASGVSKNFHKNDMNYGINFSSSATIYKNPIYVNNVNSNVSNRNIRLNLDGNIAWKEILSFDFGGNLFYTETKNSDTAFTNNHTRTNSYYLNSKWQPTHRLTIQWNNRYNKNSNASPGYPSSWLFSDASVLYSLLKSEDLQVRLSAYDIFNQNKGAYRYAYGNQITDILMLVQKQFLMFTVTYKFKKLGK